MNTPEGGRSEGGQEPLPGAPELIAQLREAVQALNAAVSALREVALRPPVELHVERLEVETIEFRLGDIDVEELQGELNIGITQSLRPVLPAKPEEGRPQVARAPVAAPKAVLPTVPAQKRVQLWPPPETEGSDKR